jgi:signal recognition particle GTPase
VFLFGPSRLRSKQSTWQRIQKKLLRADVLLFIAIFMYVGMTENFANKNEDVDIPSIYSTGNIVCDLKKGNLILLMGGHTNEIKVSTQRNQNRWIQPTRNQD